MFFLVSISISAQNITITGVVSDAVTKEPVPGAGILVKGTTKGFSADFDGKYAIKVNKGDVLQFSSIGYKTKEITVQNQTTINVYLEEDVESLDEIVIVGYGTQKKADLTSAISTIETSEIAKVQTSQVVQGFQGQVAGVQISSKGSPGDTPEVNIRGINSLYGNSAPLYVVDGMFYNSIDFLNASEISDISILKDASASAIYGVRAANGVVLVTTKGGRFNKKAQIEYTSSYGIQRAQNVLKMANAEQFTTFALESGSASEIASIDMAMQRFGRSRINPNIPDVNTDWYKETLRVAEISSHDIQVNGGTDKVAYSVGGNFLFQEGILKMKNSFERFNLRAKVDAKVRDWLTVGANFLNSRAVKYADEGSAWQLTYYAVPILPVTDQNFTDATSTPYADAREIGYRGSQNPFPLLNNSDRRGERRRTTANIYTDFTIIPNKLKFKSTLSYNYRATNDRNVLLPYYISDNFQRQTEQSSITRNNSVQENYIIDNVLTYTNSFGDHDLTFLAGTSFRDDYFRSFGANGNFDPSGAFLRDNEKTWYINNTAPDSRIAYDGGSRFYGFSYFGRASYKYLDKYIAYATYRAEGSNKYDQTYVHLPAVGLAWVVSREDFFGAPKNFNFLKLRAGWGRLANDAVPASIPQSANTTSTVFNDNQYTGFQFSTAADDLGWEFTEELNVGATANLFDNRLSLELDYFIKDTKNLAIPVLPLVGTDVSFQNVGSVRNKGFELTAGWNQKLTDDLSLSLSGNFSSIKNEITDLEGQPHLDRGSAEFRQRLEVGQPINVFYGWVLDGVYQNNAEIAADPTAQAAINDGVVVKPGYFRYKDLNNDGVLDAQDRTHLGSPVPTYYYGANLGLNYKDFELSVQVYGQGGNVILNRNRAEVIRTQGRNVDAQLAINRWRGEGTSNSYPSSEGYRQLWNQRMSGFWLDEGDFFRVQNIQIAYNLSVQNLPDIRLSFTADRPFISTKSFNGFNPEVGFDGVDLQTYPVPSVYSLGVKIKF